MFILFLNKRYERGSNNVTHSTSPNHDLEVKKKAGKDRQSITL